MQSLLTILQKKLRQPRFRQMALFGKLKRITEEFFAQKNIAVKVGAFDPKQGILSLIVSHPSISREVLTYHMHLNALCKRQNLPAIKKMTMRIARRTAHL